jgi:hypothetical protein
MTKKLTPEQLAKNKADREAAGFKSGRPAFVPTPEQRAYVLQMTGMGAPQELICSAMRNGDSVGISLDTLKKYFQKELDEGVSQANLKVAGTLFKMAVSGDNIAATIFWLKVRARWRESATTVELTGKDGEPLNPAGPGTVPIEEYKAALRDVLKEY